MKPDTGAKSPEGDPKGIKKPDPDAKVKKPVARKPATEADVPPTKKPAADTQAIKKANGEIKPPASEQIQAEPPANEPEATSEAPAESAPVAKKWPSKAQQGVWGIDLGQCGLKALRLQEIDGQLTATAFDYVEHPKILSQPDADPDQLTREALEKFLARNQLRGDLVAISVPGQSGLARFVKLPPVEEKKIADIVRFEAKQQIPFNLEEVVWDFQKVGAGQVTDGFAMDTEIGLFAMKRDMVSRYLQHFKDVNVEVHIIQMAPLALCNFAAYDLLRKGRRVEGAEEGDTQTGCVVVLDIGTDSSNLVITDGDRVIWQRPIPLGGNHFTRALTKDLKLTFAKAEHLKRNATKSPDLKKILSSLKPILNDFVSEVQRSLGYFTNTHRDAQIEYMIGLGNAFRLPGLQRFLEEKLQLSVRKLQKLDRLVGDSVLTAQVYSENIMTFGVAYGLALQGLKQTRLLTNLLPPEIRTERLIRAKKPWAVAAAAALLLGLGSVTAGYGLSYRSYHDDDVKKAIDKVTKIKKRAADAEAAFKKVTDDALKEEESVKSLLAGQHEFLNWLEMTKFLGQAIPRPDGSNLPHKDGKGKPRDYKVRNAEGKEEIVSRCKYDYFLNDKKEAAGSMSGKRAFEELQSRLQGLRGPTLLVKPVLDPKAPMPKGEKPATIEVAEDTEKGLDDLIQINTEAIDCRFTDDLASVWRVIRTKVGKAKDGNIRPTPPQPPQVEKLPEGKGWVVEIRGYTFHREGTNFLVDTFVQNLFEKGLPDFTEEVAPPPATGAPKTGPVPATPPGTAPAPGPGPGATKPPVAQPGVQPPAPAEVKPVEERPVINRISHVVLFDSAEEKTADTQSFKLIGVSVLDPLIQASGGGGRKGGGPGGPPPGPQAGQPGAMPGAQPGAMPGSQPGVAPGLPGPDRDGWVPLTSLSGGTRGTGLPQPQFNPRAGLDAKSSNHLRTEFVILFFWKEKSSLDSLLYGPQVPATTPGGKPPVGGSPTGGPPTGGPPPGR